MRYLLHDVFTQTVARSPQSIAIKEEDGKETTYSVLNQLANKFSACFYSLKEDVRKNPFIGILSSVHTTSIAAVIGALKIGCAYVPFDEYSPTERLLHILNNTGLDILVIDDVWYQYHKKLFDHPCLKKIIVLSDIRVYELPNLINLEDIERFSSEDPPVINQVSDDLAYILHSSGSTGIPKGIMLTHRNARTFVDWMDKEFKLTYKDTIISRAPFKFDLSIFDIFNTFKSGARLICYNWNRKREGNTKHEAYVKLMEREGATILYTTPSTFITLMNNGRLAQAKLQLKKVMYAGEPFPIPQLKELKRILPAVKVANIYGPTETNIITYYWIEDILEESTAIPLGNTVEDTEIIVVTEDQNRICPVGEIGELWCRGGTVTLGYLGRPEKTEECLVQSPFHFYPCYFWRTGDYGFRDEQGLLHYRGRKDHMVKVKGYRIEIGEIESALANIRELDEFAVVAIPHPDYSHELFCFFSCLTKKNVSIEQIKNFLKTKVPSYMLPSAFIKLETMPKTSSGKVDRVTLAESLK